MRILWDLEEGSVRQVIAELPAQRRLAYTSVATILRILEQKKVISARKDGRTHIYRPRLGRREFEANYVSRALANVFDGTPKALVRCLLDSSSLSRDQLVELKALIDAKLARPPRSR